MIANQVAGLLGGGAPPAPLGDYESIQTVTVGSGGSATIDFTSIPSTYKHLQIRGIAITSVATYWAVGNVKLNNDAAGNYSFHSLFGTGSTTGTFAQAGASYFEIQYGIAGNSNTSGIFGASIIDILDYSNTTTYKTIRNLNGRELNGGGSEDRIGLSSASWRSTSAVNQITISAASGSFQQYSSFALYGIKG